MTPTVLCRQVNDTHSAEKQTFCLTLWVLQVIDTKCWINKFMLVRHFQKFPSFKACENKWLDVTDMFIDRFIPYVPKKITIGLSAWITFKVVSESKYNFM